MSNTQPEPKTVRLDDESSGHESTNRDTQSTATAEITSALFAENLRVTYPTAEEPAVDCHRIDLPEGKISAIIGPNGSGKSTLLKALANHMEPEHGDVVLDGRDMQEFGSKELARKLGHLSQDNVSPESISVEELIYHGRYPHRSFFEPVSEADRSAVDRAIQLADIEHLRDRNLGQLSGGQEQLVWIAMVLAQETDVLLLDEPTTFLDLNHQLRVMETIQTLNRDENVTIATVLHDIGQAVRYADYLIALDDGGVYDWGPAEDVITEALLADVFNVEAQVLTHRAGAPLIHPEAPIDE